MARFSMVEYLQSTGYNIRAQRIESIDPTIA